MLTYCLMSFVTITFSDTVSKYRKIYKLAKNSRTKTVENMSKNYNEAKSRNYIETQICKMLGS